MRVYMRGLMHQNLRIHIIINEAVYNESIHCAFVIMTTLILSVWTAADGDEGSDFLWIPNRTQTALLEIWFIGVCQAQLVTAIMHLLAVSSVLKWMYTNTHSSKLFFIHSGADVLQVICMLNNVNIVLVAWSEIRAWHIELNELNTTKHVLSLKGPTNERFSQTKKHAFGETSVKI